MSERLRALSMLFVLVAPGKARSCGTSGGLGGLVISKVTALYKTSFFGFWRRASKKEVRPCAICGKEGI